MQGNKDPAAAAGASPRGWRAMTTDTFGDDGSEGRRGRRGGSLASLWAQPAHAEATPRALSEAAAWRLRRRGGVALAMLASALLAPSLIAGGGELPGGRANLFLGGAPAGNGHGSGAQGGGARHDPADDLRGPPSTLQPGHPANAGPSAGDNPDADGHPPAGRDPSDIGQPGMTFLAPGPDGFAPSFGPGFGKRGSDAGGGGGGGGGSSAGGPGGGGSDKDGGRGPEAHDPGQPDQPVDPFGGDPHNDLGGGGGDSHDDPGGGGASVPEPATWAMMIFGFGAAGYALRRRRLAANGWPARPHRG